MVVGRFVTVYLYVNDFDIAAYTFLLGPRWGVGGLGGGGGGGCDL